MLARTLVVLVAMSLDATASITDWLVSFDSELSSVSRRREEAFRSFQHAFSTCNWLPSDNFTYTYQESNADWWENVGIMEMRRTWTCAAGRWRILKTDPVDSVGGFDWHFTFNWMQYINQRNFTYHEPDPYITP